MAPQPETENGSEHSFNSGECRNRSKLNSMSIKELVSELRDSFMSTDFDRVEEILVAREARLKAELDEMKREIGILKEQVIFERLGKINVEFELRRVKKEMCKEKKVVKNDNNNGFGLDCKVVKVAVGCEKSKLGGVDEVESEKALEEKKKLVGGELKSENKKEFCEEGKRVIGNINRYGSEPLKKNEDGVSDSGGKLGMVGVIDIEDSDEDLCNSQATLDRKKTTSCTLKDNEHQRSSGHKNLPTGQAEPPFRILKRKTASSCKLGTNINVLDGSDSDTSSSSSSSSSSSGSHFDVDSLPLTSNKKKRADVGNLGLNTSKW